MIFFKKAVYALNYLTILFNHKQQQQQNKSKQYGTKGTVE